VSKGRVLGVVPARLASSRFPRKVLAELSGRPVIAHVVARLLQAERIDEVLVATDSPEVRDVVAPLGVRVILATEACPTGTDRVASAVRDLDAAVIVNLQADQPFIDSRDIDGTIDLLAMRPEFDVTTLAYPADDDEGYRSRDVVKVVVDRRGRALYFSRAPIPSSKHATGSSLYLHHVGVYCFRRESLARFAAFPRTELEEREGLEQLRALEHGMAVGVVLTGRKSCGIDRVEDLARAGERS
jgi:3-deoxy-manno-octulosonate cytidylyltransferase (CMP-KDO synthetase)